MLKSASTSRGTSLSKAWEVAKAHKGAYSGGKVQLSNDGSFVACLYEDDVSFLGVDEGVVTRRLRKEGAPGAEEEIVSFALHPNGSEIVTASRSLLLRHWDIDTQECKRAIKAHDHRVLCMDYDGTGTLVATGSSDHTVKVWDVERGYCTHNFRGHTGIVSVVAFHPDPKRLLLVSGSEDTTVRVWDLSKQSCTALLKSHLSYVTSLAFLSGGKGLVSGGRDRVLNVWGLESAELLKTFPVYEEVEGLQVLPETGKLSQNFPTADGESLVAVAGKNGVVRVFALAGQREVLSSEDNGDGKKKKKKKGGVAAGSKKLTCRCVMSQNNRSASHKAGYRALLLDRRRGGLIGVTADHNLLLLEAERSRSGGANPGVGARGSLVARRQIVGYNDEIIDIKSLPRGVGGADDGDGESWVAVATNSPQVRLFELGDFSCRLLDGHTETVLALDVAPDGRHLCTSSKDRTCLLWDLDLDIPVVRWSGHADAVGAIAASRKPGPWSPTASSGTAAFVVSGGADRTLQRWDVPCRAVAELVEEARALRGVAAAAAVAAAVSEGEQAFAKAGKGGWKPPAPLLETARRSVRAHEKDINCVTVAPNDAVIASASQDRTVKLWRAKDLEPMGVLKGHKRGVWKVEFSPVDRCVATCSGDRTVKVWSIADFSCLRTFQGHTASVLSVAFVSAGAQLVSGGADGLLKVWTLSSDECETTLDSHTDKVWALTTASVPRRSREDEEDEDGGEGGGLLQSGPNAGLVVVSGGADSVINVWKDVTVQQEEKEIAEKEAMLLKEQELYNRLRNKDYGPAIALALELKRPHRLWSVLRDAMTEGMGEGVPDTTDIEATTEMSSRQLDQHVAAWSMDTISQCLGYCRDWNTNAKKAVVVHALVGSLLRCVSLSSLKELPGCADLVRALLPYSERHFQRLDRLLQSSYLVEHTLSSMQMLVDESGAAPVVQSSGTRSQRPLVRELKRLREARERGEGGVDAGDDSSSGSEGEGGGVVPIPEFETVDGRVVFNVMLEPENAGDESDSDDDAGDVEMGEVFLKSSDGPLPEAGVEGEAGEEEESSVRPHKKKKKRKGHTKSVPLGLVGQPEPVAEATPVSGKGEKEEVSGSGKKKRRKRRKSSGPAEEVGEEKSSAVAEAVEAAVVVEKSVEEPGEEEGGSKKRKKRSGKGRRRSSAV